ncbi:MAG: nicotinamide riboside transporter PnuC [Candidatus Methylacidiphilales bacterium]
MKFTLIELLEIIVIITTLLYNYFLIKQQIICWLFGFLSSVTGLVIFHEKQLIGQVILHVFYALMAIYGWYIWGKNKQELKVKKWTISMQAYILSFGFIISFVLSNFVLNHFIENINVLDILITVFCFIATFKETHKIVTAWIYWIVLNAASFVLYLQSDLFIYALLMLIYTALSIKGYLTWNKELKTNDFQSDDY